MLLTVTEALAGQAPPNASSRHEIGQPGEPARDDDETIEGADPDPTPKPVPVGGEQPRAPVDPDVVEQAGVGGPVPYGAAGVLEVGGAGSVSLTQETGSVRLRPFIGWFVYDGVELTFSNDILFVNGLDDELRVAVRVMLEPSVHFPIEDRLWLAVGIGAGLMYNGDTVGAAVEPRVGVDLLVGRSGLLHISLLATFTTTDLVGPAGGRQPGDRMLGGLELAYAVMF
jgi:hypothetical protein